MLDPTCGSGAFLFATLNILEPLYEACLDRMEVFLEELARSGVKHRPEKFSDFRKILDRVASHPNRRYFILKSIILNNLYGVDIMEEAVEICKLRLFLKLVAQVEKVEQIEPLPDIDFNIRAGNTLVGYATYEQVKYAVTSKLDFDNTMVQIEEKAQDVDRLFSLFHQLQTEHGMDAKDFVETKQKLRKRLKTLEDELNRYLAQEYNIAPAKRTQYEKWLASHKPFHWFIEFYRIMKSGGFDVIIGNPPYVELSSREDYKTRGYKCEDAGNLYALVIERCDSVGAKKGRQGFIVPVSSVSTDRYKSLQKLILRREGHFSSYEDRPSRLFDGLEHIRLTIHILGRKVQAPQLFSTRYNKWSSDERASLFGKLSFIRSAPNLVEGTLPKLFSNFEQSIILKLASEQYRLSSFYSRIGSYRVFYSRKVGYFLQVLDFEPRVLDGRGQRRPPSEFKELNFGSENHARLALSCLNANLFYWFITVFSDCRHVNKREVDAFPIDLSMLAGTGRMKELVKLGRELMEDLDQNSEERTMRFRHDMLTVQCIYPKASKTIMDEIDGVLAQHYGFTDEELDFIINYDIKYRMGADTESDDEK